MSGASRDSRECLPRRPVAEREMPPGRLRSLRELLQARGGSTSGRQEEGEPVRRVLALSCAEPSEDGEKRRKKRQIVAAIESPEE
ncbi:unnamed protein product, partial [Polarella glacialis]